MPDSARLDRRQHYRYSTGTGDPGKWGARTLAIPVKGAPKNIYGRGAADATGETLLARRNSSDGGGVVVGVVDTGWRPHYWSAGAVLAAPDDLEELDQDGVPGLEHQAGHGTFVSGLVLQQAQAAAVRMERALSGDGSGSTGAVAQAALRLVARGADVLNLSLGTRDGAPGAPGEIDAEAASRLLMDELFGLDPDLVVVAAAGNLDEAADGTCEDAAAYWPAALSGDAAYPNLLAVGALDRYGRWPTWSNFGNWVDLAAPGDQLLSTYLFYTPPPDDPDPHAQRYRGWAAWSGTSFATAVVSGQVARTMSRRQVSGPEAVALLKAEAATRVRNVPVVPGDVQVVPDAHLTAGAHRPGPAAAWLGPWWRDA